MELHLADCFYQVLKSAKTSDADLSLSAYPPTKDIGEHPFYRHFWLFPKIRNLYLHRFTPVGRSLFGITCLMAIYAALSIDLQAYVPCCYFFALWLIAMIAVFFAKPRVSMKVHHVQRIGAGGLLEVEVEVVRERGGVTADLFVSPDRLPQGVDFNAADGVPVRPLAVGETASVRYTLQCLKRGVYRLKGHRVDCDHPLGLLRAYRVIPDERPLIVYPTFTPLTRLSIPSGRKSQPGGVALASNVGESFDYLGNREYRYGDNRRNIDWRSTARLDRPIVREYRQEYFTRVAVLLDTHIPPGTDTAREPAFERAVSLCAAITDSLARQDYIVDLFAAGPNLYHMTAGRSLAYLEQILDILACVESSPTEPFSVIEPELQANFERINTVICIFLDWDETRNELVEKLARAGAGVKSIVVSDDAMIRARLSGSTAGHITVLSRQEFAGGLMEL